MMKQRTLLFILLLAGSWLGTMRQAAADACTAVNNTFTMPSALVIPRDLPVGAPISDEIITGTFTVFRNCTKTTTGSQNVGSGTNATFVQTIPGARLYATGIPGVSYSLAVTQPGGCSATTIVGGNAGYQGNPNMRNHCINTGNWTTVTFQYKLRFYKTAAVTGSGNVDSLAAAYAFVRYDGSGFITPYSNLTVTGITAKTTTCSVTNSNINIKLDTAKGRDFNGIGSTAGSTAFNIGLSNCDADLNVSMTLSPGSGGSSNKSLGLLTTDDTSSASGLALQLMYNNAPVQLDTAFRVLGAATTDGGTYQIPLAVRYYQTATEIVSGTVNSSATFTMTYN
ncbi:MULTISPECIES: fimbrial protein [unclassified Serratia (in: enterobacteria)]|uniref:fimbrial protein n=1 Tax=unclassified Serratia (in: enterobacteria) TaxID=2647522 RepID=UPI0012E0254E|nr:MULTISPECIES: fimbrial protein [unclassified Serratia (in: enterobacteria)]